VKNLIISVADAIVAELNTAAPPHADTFNQTFIAARHYRPQFDLAELRTLRVSVVPKGITITSSGRNSNQHDIAIDVAVQKKVDADDQEALDGLMLLTEQIADFFRLRRLAKMPDAIWIRTENVPVYSPEHLESKQVFTSVLTFSFRVVR